MIKLFDIPLEDKGLHEKLNIEKVELSHLYDCFIRTETYIAAHYYARFDPSIKKYLLMPERYLYDDAPFMEETMAVSNKWKKKIFKSFPRKGIDLEWPTYDWTTYPYDNQKNNSRRDGMKMDIEGIFLDSSDVTEIKDSTKWESSVA